VSKVFQRNPLRVAIDADYRAPRERARIGGDFSVCQRRGDGIVCTAIGDVSAKGTYGRALAHVLKRAFAFASLRAERPEALLQALNAVLVEALRGEQGSEIFSTALVCCFHPNRRLCYAAAGTEGPLIARDGECHYLPSAGDVILGLHESSRYHEQIFTFEPGDRLIAVTDGVTESRSASYSTQRIGLDAVADAVDEALRRDHALTARDLFGHIDAYNGGRYEDDATILVASGLRRR
jgi:serine phosphatase RsbU (regulator of sigma subunit)